MLYGILIEFQGPSHITSLPFLLQQIPLFAVVVLAGLPGKMLRAEMDFSQRHALGPLS